MFGSAARFGWLVGLVGCVVTARTTEEELRDGSLIVTWSVGASGCEAAGVADVELTIGDRSEVFSCDAGGADVTVPSGRQEVLATGLDGAGFARYEGSAVVVVPAGDEATAHVTLAARPAFLEVTWFFENGRLCAANDAAEIRVTVFDADDYVVAESSHACEDGLADVPDLDAGTYGVRIDALDAEGAFRYSGKASVELGKGELGSVEVELADAAPE